MGTIDISSRPAVPGKADEAMTYAELVVETLAVAHAKYDERVVARHGGTAAAHAAQGVCQESLNDATLAAAATLTLGFSGYGAAQAAQRQKT